MTFIPIKQFLRKDIFWYILLWLAVYGFYLYQNTFYEVHYLGSFFYYAGTILLMMVVYTIAVFINIGFLVPNLLYRKRYKLFILFFLLCAVSLGWVVSQIEYHYMIKYYVLKEWERAINWTWLNNSLLIIFYSTLVFAINSVLRRIQEEKLRLEIKEKQHFAEVQFLRAQFSPHFLFNTINTIFLLIGKDSQRAKETLLTLSEMLRYQLYECNGKYINIEQEVDYLKNYIGIQRMRKSKLIDINANFDSNLNNFQVAPLMLLPFVENAFKYVSHFPNKRNYVDIDLRRESNDLVFHISNSKETKNFEAPDVEKKYKGIGIKNVKRRLELLYPEQYQLDVKDVTECYTVKLKLSIQE
ncbi:histidine kinase [Limibacter armeniacum]|uniref:sensor histidine kinase n=1 Tax=Limibacter armeniacum TaxID=466084 RepID=UPI002FE5D29F